MLPLQERSARTLTDALIDRRNADGGWGAAAGLPSNAECTALACLALRPALGAGGAGAEVQAADRQVVRNAGEAWLRARQQPVGAWYYGDSGAPATWPTPLVLLALLRDPAAANAVERGYDWLLRLRGERFPWRQRLREFVTRERVVELDSTLDGWPWTPGAFPWVEPTAWALVALKARWPNRVPRVARGRMRDGESMLLDRECGEGGWNYGNSRVMGQDLDPYPDTTAIALLGLRGRRTDAVERGFRTLDRLLAGHASRLALSLALISHRAWRRESAVLRTRLREDVAASGAPADQRTLALVALALGDGLDWLGEERDA